MAVIIDNLHIYEIQSIVLNVSNLLQIAEQSSSHRRFRGIELKGVKIYDLQKVTFSTLFKLYIAGLGVLIPKRYHM